MTLYCSMEGAVISAFKSMDAGVLSNKKVATINGNEAVWRADVSDIPVVSGRDLKKITPADRTVRKLDSVALKAQQDKMLNKIYLRNGLALFAVIILIAAVILYGVVKPWPDTWTIGDKFAVGVLLGSPLLVTFFAYKVQKQLDLLEQDKAFQDHISFLIAEKCQIGNIIGRADRSLVGSELATVLATRVRV